MELVDKPNDQNWYKLRKVLDIKQYWWPKVSLKELGLTTMRLLMLEFDMKELGEARKILGMEIIRDTSKSKAI